MEEDQDPDLVLFAEWRAGDRSAGERLFSLHFSDVHRFFSHKVACDADELTQRTFLACVRARDQFRAGSTFRTYLFTIARHELYAYFRRHSRDSAIDFEISGIADIQTSPSSRLDRLRRATQLRENLASLPLEQQLLLELHYWHGLDAVALAVVFEVPAGTVRVRLLRARKALRERMGPPERLQATEEVRAMAAAFTEQDPTERDRSDGGP